MIRTVIKKSEFKPIDIQGERCYYISFAFTPEVEVVYEPDPETQEPKPTGGVKDTDYAVVTMEIIHDTPNINYIYQLIRDRYNKYPEQDPNPMKSLVDIARALEIPDEQIKDKVLQLILDAITIYDKSDSVNSFSLNGMNVWLDRDTRVSLMNSTQIQKSLNSETTTLWLGDISLEINCDLAIGLLSQLEVYALGCYNKTAEHKAKVKGLETVDEVVAYDYTAGYPEKLVLNTNSEG